MLISTGIPTEEDLAKVVPSVKRLGQGPCSVIECFQEIPCNPCVKACHQGAITMPNDINDIPVVDYDKCNGCGLCVLYCPGLAIFTVDKTYSAEKALVTFPFEYVPVPEKGRKVIGLNRGGKEMGEFEVVRVIRSNAQNKTCAITLKVPQELAMEVRNIKVGGYK